MIEMPEGIVKKYRSEKTVAILSSFITNNSFCAFQMGSSQVTGNKKKKRLLSNVSVLLR